MKSAKTGQPLENFTYSNVRISNSDPNKWYVGYILTTEDGIKEKRKEFGKESYKISLAKEKDPIAREKLAKRLMNLVIYDLEKGIDPKFRNAAIDKQNIQKLKELQKHEDDKISMDDAIQMCKVEKGWINPVPTKENSARSIPMFFNNQLKPYFESLGKADDIRQVTRTDIKNLIERHFNATKESEFENWVSSTCSIVKTRIAILFNVLVEKDLIPISPTVGIKIKPDSEKIVPINPDDEDVDRFEPWTDTEVHHLFEDLKVSEMPVEKVMYVASNIIYYAFIRKSELLRLKCWMVNIENERFTLPPNMTKSANKYSTKDLVNVDIPNKLLEVLKDWLALVYPNGFDKDDYLIPNRRNGTKRQYVYSTYTMHFVKLRAIFQKKYEEQNLYKDKSQYALKHTGVQMLFKTLSKSNRTPQEIQSIIQTQCRHSSYLQTEKYLRKLKLEFNGKRDKVNF